MTSGNFPASAAEADAAASRVARPEVLVIAHRGDSKVAPENTLPAFASAIKANADFVELDYFHSADGVPVVIHDSTLDRTTNAVKLWGGEKIKVDSKSLRELGALDAGSWFGVEFSGTRLPTLGESLDVIQNGSMTLIERKGGDPQTCLTLLGNRKLLARVVVQSFDWQYLTGCRRLSNDLVLAALGENELSAARLDEIADTGATIVAWNERDTTAESIRAIHARGWKAWAYTVDSPARVRQLVTAKIDGIITNRPGPTRAAIAAAKGPQ
jgi:glycerophosphoryl diester phosphodiesterase